ncbi:DUF3883 domain-containing protein [Lysinibacillus antri]|uniref:DUF3883 domain-containing protein n=1 Tax=Lysinibacillus antri TaxID=2498145 RepID=A0A432L746_9BACI|nr:DUF3883 domain-containing protein [Lysinibacillus antri]RUL47230.1 DUF3883 domain-containing protein [Lysinibacillus antri]
MVFSVGILYSVQKFLQFISDTKIKAIEFSAAFNRYESTSSQIVLEVAESFNWIQLDLEGNLSVTVKGNEILTQKDMLYALRVQLKHLIEMVKPSWSYLIHKGRKEAFQYFPSDVKQCFKEAELINSYDRDVIEWWDILALAVRGKQLDTQLEIGRTGEELSLEYERKRVNKEPVWQSIESNLSGFDILSVVSLEESTPLRIEVKTSTNVSGTFTFYLTRNEWNVAETSENYLFHLWILSETPEIFIIDKNAIAKHIPTNQGNGSWENVKIIFTLKELNSLDIKE